MTFASPATASALHYSKARLRRLIKSRQLRYTLNEAALSAAQHVVVCVVRNEGHRLAFFLDYYRRLGFEHFIFIDNQSSDSTADILAGQADISVVSATGSYKAARFGNDWVNEVINRLCREKWVLYVDADEFLVFPHDDRRGISDLTAHLARHGLRSLRAIMVDMYGRGRLSDNVCEPGRDPLDICPLFDRSGYVRHHDPRENTTWIKGGVRGRIYFRERLWDGPALNKIPLVHVCGERLYLKSSHQIWPLALNLSDPVGIPPVTGALLHFKFLSTFVEKVTDQSNLSEHTAEYAAYTAGAGNEVFLGAESQPYTGWRDLFDNGLIDGGGWDQSM
ncbi:glycosyltransferase family 2 protein [Rhizobium sp. G187]|uniref:glycosyltransferase family 2 protein n=1 Tax=unclassified Rhizobium TaxID=2613769 RepID=UPI0006B94663|nr:glycosyltransferase family 2 protein [Rhizobium sp. AAP43]KPF41994.1 hypothetical protein IP76_18905 [Rhizobium sp. AAP43]